MCEGVKGIKNNYKNLSYIHFQIFKIFLDDQKMNFFFSIYYNTINIKSIK